jgi:hypothetical protein
MPFSGVVNTFVSDIVEMLSEDSKTISVATLLLFFCCFGFCFFLVFPFLFFL